MLTGAGAKLRIRSGLLTSSFTADADSQAVALALRCLSSSPTFTFVLIWVAGVAGDASNYAVDAFTVVFLFNAPEVRLAAGFRAGVF